MGQPARSAPSQAAAQETIVALRQKMERIGGTVPQLVGGSYRATVPRPVGAGIKSSATVASPEWIRSALDGGGLPRAATTHISDCPIAHSDMLAALTHAGQCAAIVGYPQLALAAVEAAGGDLERLVVIPDATPHEAAVVGTLVEGMDLVLYRPHRRITPTFARPVEARLRKSHCALVVTGQAWPHTNLHVEVSMAGIAGLGRGSGRITSVELAGRVWGTAQPPRQLHGVIEEPYPRKACVDGTRAVVDQAARARVEHAPVARAGEHRVEARYAVTIPQVMAQ